MKNSCAHYIQINVNFLISFVRVPGCDGGRASLRHHPAHRAGHLLLHLPDGRKPGIPYQGEQHVQIFVFPLQKSGR